MDNQLAPIKKYQLDPVTGKFLPGNPGGPGGNPIAGKVLKLRSAMLSVVDPDLMRDMMRGLLDIAQHDRSGRTRVAAYELLFNYTLGKPTQPVDLNVSNSDSPVAYPVDLTPSEIATLSALRDRMTKPPIDVREPD